VIRLELQGLEGKVLGLGEIVRGRRTLVGLGKARGVRDWWRVSMEICVMKVA